MRAVHVEPGDIVTVTHSIPGWTNAEFRVITMTEEENGRIRLFCKAYNSSILDDSPGATIEDTSVSSALRLGVRILKL